MIKASKLIVLSTLVLLLPVFAQDSTPDGSGTPHSAVIPETQRTWGLIQHGLHASLGVDKTTLRLGEDLPLHIALENVAAERPIYGEPYHSRVAFADHSSMSVGIRVEDEDGPLTPTLQEMPKTEHGPTVCPAPFEPGKQIVYEWRLSQVGLLPSKAGTYRVTVVWSPFTTETSSCENAPPYDPDSARDRPYVSLVSNSIELKVTDGSGSPREYTMWKQHFKLSDTSFGPKTALLDAATHLEWLRLNFSANLAYRNVIAQMVAGGRFEGWRYATAAELEKFFHHFTGAAGATTDPLIEAKLQRLLGGPLDTPRNPTTGWHRAASLGLVADVSQQGRELRGYIGCDNCGDPGEAAMVTSEIWGYAKDDFAVQASYLVRKR